MGPLMSDPWPEFIFLLAGGLKAGMGLEKALLLAIQEAPEHFRKEILKRAGPGFEPQSVENKINLLFSGSSLAFVRSVVLISHETGAPQAKILEMCGRLLRERSEFSEKVKMLTLQSRLTGWIVGLSPIVFLLCLSFVSPEMTKPLFETAEGLKLLGGSAISTLIGLWLVHRMARIEP